MAYWCCAQLEARRERLPLHCLSKVNGFETYSPRIRPARARRGDDTRPLFPGYCFVLIVLQLHAARWAPGVTRIVLDGGMPARVPDGVIDELRAREHNGLVVLPERELVRGTPVRIVRGPFRELEGLYAGQAPHERVAVLLARLGRVTLPKDDVKPI
jgi:transcriptional antiterminator RfaH